MNLFEIQKARVTENLQRSYGQNELAKALEGEELAKGKKANLGEIREWGGKKYQKTTQGWKEIRGGSKGGEGKKEGGEEKSSYSGSDFKLFDSLMWDSLVDRFPDKEAELEEYTLATDAILSKYLKKEVGDYVQTGGGRTFSHNAFDELKTLPKEKYNKMIDQLWAKAKKFGFNQPTEEQIKNNIETTYPGERITVTMKDGSKVKYEMSETGLNGKKAFYKVETGKSIPSGPKVILDPSKITKVEPSK